MCVTCRHLSVIRSTYFFDQHRPIGNHPIFAVILSHTGRGIGEVHLVPLRIEHEICSKYLLTILIVCRLANVPRFVDECKAVEAVGSLGEEVAS